ncbi:MAG: aminodeoxychorismate/anthranilate synthase component II [Blautia sp.]|nr:aminodeoxychorismate/anthranilate synthase component II [Lachnoclostridium sp.]MCM1211402.1 aminodeoxychorismate/anthranilate synthase component II [Blautia sp.]
MILLIDNYDSFSYNLFQLIGSLNPDIKVIRNDAFSVEEIRNMKPDAIILSPGPGRPEDAGVCIEVVKELGKTIPILGVCLGHQSICTAYGGTISYAKELMHGKQSITEIDNNCLLFQGLPDKIPVARYHSLALIEDTLPECLTITARTQDGEVMAVAHKTYPVYGVQFHPESILTPDGKTMVRNFLDSLEKEK